jgi:hypothetical protein
VFEYSILILDIRRFDVRGTPPWGWRTIAMMVSMRTIRCPECVHIRTWKLKLGGTTLEERPEGKQDYFLLGFDAVYSGTSLPMLQRNLVLPLSGSAHRD